MSRVLCLHGYHGSGRILRGQVGDLAGALAAAVAPVFVDAPSLADGDHGWWHATDAGYAGWDRSRAAVVGQAATGEPLDGLLGFSQGAAFAGLLVGACPRRFAFAILIGGFVARDPALAHVYTQAGAYAVPSLHVIGRADRVVPGRDSHALAARFTAPVVIEHDGGHVIPADPGVHRQIVAFVAAVAGCYQPVSLGPTYADAVLADAPVAYWPMDDASGPAVRDEIGFAPGTASGTCTFGVTGILPTGPAIEFAGHDCAIDVGGELAFAGSASFTIEAWADYDQADATPFREVFARELRDGAPIDGYGLSFRTGTAVFFERVTSTQAVTTPDAIVSASSHYLAATFDAPTMSLYVDGVLAQTASDATPIAAPAVDALIGAASATDSHFTGAINQVAAYDHALAADRVAAHFAAGQP